MAHSATTEARRQIVEIIGNCVYHALGLMETLEEERKALEQQDMAALSTVIESKGRCVNDLRSVEEERKQVCIDAGFSDGPDQMVQMIEWCDDSSIVANCWQHLMDIAIECNALNITNGAIIRGRKQQIESSISIVRGGNPTMDTYNRSGTEPHGQHLRSIAEA